MINVSLTLSGNLIDMLAGKIDLRQVFAAGDLEAVIQNRQKHAVIAEFGSGIYNDGTGPKQEIKAKNGTFTIPIVDKYVSKLDGSIIAEARQNAIEYPDIMSRLKTSNRGLVGFIFRNSFKGMKPIRMVRGTRDKAEQRLQQEIQKAVEYLLSRSYQRTLTPRDVIARAINTTAAYWLREIIKASPVLTSNLKTGWTITRLAK
jgi:hypothetical protein